LVEAMLSLLLNNFLFCFGKINSVILGVYRNFIMYICCFRITKSIIYALEDLLRKSKAEVFEKELYPLSLAQLNAGVDKALDDERNNRLIGAEDLKNKIRQRELS
jgi:hypothetical protein